MLPPLPVTAVTLLGYNIKCSSTLQFLALIVAVCNSAFGSLLTRLVEASHNFVYYRILSALREHSSLPLRTCTLALELGVFDINFVPYGHSMARTFKFSRVKKSAVWYIQDQFFILNTNQYRLIISVFSLRTFSVNKIIPYFN